MQVHGFCWYMAQSYSIKDFNNRLFLIATKIVFFKKQVSFCLHHQNITDFLSDLLIFLPFCKWTEWKVYWSGLIFFLRFEFLYFPFGFWPCIDYSVDDLSEVCKQEGRHGQVYMWSWSGCPVVLLLHATDPELSVLLGVPHMMAG